MAIVVLKDGVLNLTPGLVQKSTEPTGPGRNLLTQEDDS